jgi:hypothetical protein
MSTEHDEQPMELTYLEETVHTIQLVLYDSDKENHTPDISPDSQETSSTLWILLRDSRFIAAVTYQARAIFNWHCADLIETFVNLARLEWNGILYPGNATEQLGLDLLRRIIAADVERYYVMATEDVKNNQYGKIPAKENPIDLLFFTHHHCPHQIVPDQHHILEYLTLAKEYNK